MQEILDKAKDLGEAIASHQRVRDFFAAQKAVEGDAQAQTLLKEYQAQAEHIQTLEQQQKPIEVADKQKVAELESKMSGNDALNGLMRAQADYLELMESVNRTMEAPLAASKQPAPS